MKASNDTKNDAIITALQGLVTQVNRNTSNINSLDLVTSLRIGFGRVLMLVSASLPQLNLIK